MEHTLTIFAAADYPEHRNLALRLKAGDKSAVLEAADILLSLLSDAPVMIIPVPSHTGHPTYMLQVAQVMAQRRGKGITKVFQHLRSEPHESRHDAKHNGALPQSLPRPFTTIDEKRKLHFQKMTEHFVPILLDDIADTGTSLREAARPTGANLALVINATGNLSEDGESREGNISIGLFVRKEESTGKPLRVPITNGNVRNNQ